AARHCGYDNGTVKPRGPSAANAAFTKPGQNIIPNPPLFSASFIATIFIKERVYNDSTVGNYDDGCDSSRSSLIAFYFMFILRKKFKIRWLPFILGIGIFIVFALILEQIMHYIVLSPSADGTIELLSADPWLYVLYGIFA